MSVLPFRKAVLGGDEVFLKKIIINVLLPYYIVYFIKNYTTNHFHYHFLHQQSNKHQACLSTNLYTSQEERIEEKEKLTLKILIEDS